MGGLFNRLYIDALPDERASPGAQDVAIEIENFTSIGGCKAVQSIVERQIPPDFYGTGQIPTRIVVESILGHRKLMISGSDPGAHSCALRTRGRDHDHSSVRGEIVEPPYVGQPHLTQPELVRY